MPDDMDTAIDELIERLTLRGEPIPTRRAAARMVRASSKLTEGLIEAFEDMSLDEIRVWEAKIKDEMERRG